MLSKINGLNLFKSSVLKAFVEDLQLHSNTVSLVQWLNRLLPAQGGSGCVLGLHPHLQWNHVLLLAMSCYVDNPDVIQILATAGLFLNIFLSSVSVTRQQFLFSDLCAGSWASARTGPG